MSYVRIDAGRLRAKCLDSLDKLEKSKLEDKLRAELVCRSLLNICDLVVNSDILLSREDAYWLNYAWTENDA